MKDSVPPEQGPRRAAAQHGGVGTATIGAPGASPSGASHQASSGVFRATRDGQQQTVMARHQADRNRSRSGNRATDSTTSNERLRKPRRNDTTLVGQDERRGRGAIARTRVRTETIALSAEPCANGAPAEPVCRRGDSRRQVSVPRRVKQRPSEDARAAARGDADS